MSRSTQCDDPVSRLSTIYYDNSPCVGLLILQIFMIATTSLWHHGELRKLDLTEVVR